MIKKRITEEQRKQGDASQSGGDQEQRNSQNLHFEKILRLCADLGLPLHTIHGDVTYHFVTTNIYLCSEKSGHDTSKFKEV